MTSPFANIPQSEWVSKRDELIEDYPLELEEIHDLVIRSFEKLYQTRIGDPSDDILIYRDVPVGAQTTGAFIETIIANELTQMDSIWRQGTDAEKDLVHTAEPQYSTEIKMSGQINDEVFGNRSFAQDSGSAGKKSKSGYYLTLNVHISEEELPPSHRLFLIRFGWIDFDDWTGQAAESGQAATLPSEVYEYKLKVIDGDYLMNAPLEFVHMIGPSTIDDIRPFLTKHGITTVGEFIEAYDSDPSPSRNLTKVYEKCTEYPGNTITMGRDDIDIGWGTTQSD